MKFYCFTFFLFTYCLPQIYLSEIHSNPKHLSDAQGEYLELIHIEDVGREMQELKVFLNSDTLVIPARNWEINEVYLICRDSASLKKLNVYCQTNWPGLSLTNSVENVITLEGSGFRLTFTPPLAIEGKSWENTLDPENNHNYFEGASVQWDTGEWGTPGGFNTNTKLKFVRDLNLSQVTWDSIDQHFQITIVQNGKENISNTELTVAIDHDLNGTVDAYLYKTVLYTLHQNTLIKFWKGSPLKTGLYLFQLSNDLNITNNQIKSLSPMSQLLLTEVCPAPLEENPEWFEIKNTTDHSIHLSNLYYNHLALFENPSEQVILNPYEYVIITEDKETFNQNHLINDLNIIQPTAWNDLKNSGDTITISYQDKFSLIHSSYPGVPNNRKGECFQKNLTDGNWVLKENDLAGDFGDFGSLNESSSPGFEIESSTSFSWSLDEKVLDLTQSGSSLKIDVQSPLSPTFDLKLYDMLGSPVMKLCEKCSGNRTIIWEGRDAKNRTLPIGPYLLIASPGKSGKKKKVIILARPL